MSTEQNKATANRIPAEFSKGNVGILDQVADPKGIDHAVPPGMPNTLESTKKFMSALITAFPDLTYKIEDTIAEGDLVTQRVTVSGTMKGEFSGMKPSGKKATWSEMRITRFANGKVVEHWANVDQLGMLAQLGFGPEPGRTMTQH
jgi:predicted ester cyclase